MKGILNSEQSFECNNTLLDNNRCEILELISGGNSTETQTHATELPAAKFKLLWDLAWRIARWTRSSRSTISKCCNVFYLVCLNPSEDVMLHVKTICVFVISISTTWHLHVISSTQNLRSSGLINTEYASKLTTDKRIYSTNVMHTIKYSVCIWK